MVIGPGLIVCEPIHRMMRTKGEIEIFVATSISSMDNIGLVLPHIFWIFAKVDEL
jgi:hypothetical protein